MVPFLSVRQLLPNGLEIIHSLLLLALLNGLVWLSARFGNYVVVWYVGDCAAMQHENTTPLHSVLEISLTVGLGSGDNLKCGKNFKFPRRHCA
jgi:hypothetical protein